MAQLKLMGRIEPFSAGSDIQSIFFEMWREDHPNVALNDVPGDQVTASASGLDPDITLDNAEFLLDRVAANWADDKKLNSADVRKDIEAILHEKAHAPWGGLIRYRFSQGRRRFSFRAPVRGTGATETGQRIAQQPGALHRVQVSVSGSSWDAWMSRSGTPNRLRCWPETA